MHENRNTTPAPAPASSPMSRRAFMKSAAALGAAIAAPTIIPSSALGKDGAVAPSERIVMGSIAPGGRGFYDMVTALHEPGTQFVAVCDVRRDRRERAKNEIDGRYGNKDCAVYTDFRELLARPDIDAVIAAPGDRWHAIMAIMAMKAGKDIYCEKPSTMTIADGKALAETARKYARVMQAGMQRRNEFNFVLADELARSGRLGKVHTVYAHTLPFFMKTEWLPAEQQPAKDEFDYDLWLGPAPWRPFNRMCMGDCMAWLDWYDFGTGVAGWTSHTIAQCQGAIGCDLTSAVEYEYPNNANAQDFTCRYANGVKLVLKVDTWHGSCGVRYEGTEGWVSIADGYPLPDVSSPALLADRNKLVRDYTQRVQIPLHHMRDFLNCVRSRRQPVSHAQVAQCSMNTSHAINISMLLKRNLKFDPIKQEFVGDAEANRYLSRATREPWHV